MTICVSLSSGTPRHLKAVLRRVEMAELRLDLLGLNATEVAKLFKSAKCKTIATCRPGKYNDSERQVLLGTAIGSGANYVDIGLGSSGEFAKPLISMARKKKCKIIISHHDFKRTPETKVLWKMINNCFQKGADMAKIACFVRVPMDNLRLLRLLEGDRPVVVVGMGKEGVMTRVAALSLGSPFTYASLKEGQETAPGQLTLKEMRAILKNMGEDDLL